jgi:hypothetical protein
MAEIALDASLESAQFQTQSLTISSPRLFEIVT